MRPEVKVGLIVGLMVFIGAGIWLVRRGEDEQSSLPFDKNAMENSTGDDTKLVDDAVPLAQTPKPDDSIPTASPRPHQVTTPPARRGPAVIVPPGGRRAPFGGAPRTGADARRSASPPAESKKAPVVPAHRGDRKPANVEDDNPIPVALEPAKSRDAGAEKGEPSAKLDTPAPRIIPPRRRDAVADKPAAESRTPLRRGPAAAARKKYVIVEGDRLIDLAKDEYDDGDLWKAIKAANPGIDEDHLQVGQTIEIPSREEALKLARSAADNASASRKPGHAPTRAGKKPVAAQATYVVGRGDTLIRIARNVLGDETRWREIYELNRDELESPDLIRLGMELRLPPLKKAPAAKKGD